MEIKKVDGSKIVDTFVLVWLLFFVLIQFRLHLFEVQTRIVVASISFLLFFIYLIVKLTKGLNHLFAFIIGLFFVFVLILNFFSSPRMYLFNNFIEVLIPFSLILYLGSLLDDKNRVDKFFRMLVVPLNLYLLVNSVILYLQLNGATYLLDTTYYSDLSYDYYSGLFGGNDGTHRLTLFVSLLLILNIHFFKTFTLKTRIFNLVVFGVSFIATTYFSTQNDNVAYFIYVPIVLLIYSLLRIKSFSGFVKTFYKPILVILLFYFILGLLVKDETTGFAKIINRLNETIFSYNVFSSGSTRGPDERTRLFLIALESGGAFGNGIGSIKILGDLQINRHFGMSSIQSLVYMIGMIPFILYTSFISVYFCRLSKRKIYSFLLIFTFVFISSYFSQVLTVFNSSILFVFILTFLGSISISRSKNYQ